MNRKVFYKGAFYHFRIVEVVSRVYYVLYQHGVVEHIVPPEEINFNRRIAERRSHSGSSGARISTSH
jgi:hypothetical protein